MILIKENNYVIAQDIDGKLIVDYRYLNKYYPNLYQRVRLIVDEVEDKISSCRVYWSDIGNNVSIDSNGRWNQELTYIDTNIKLIINYVSLSCDDEYVDFLMKSLLKKERVLRYLNQGFEYVGEVNMCYEELFDKKLAKSLKKKKKK